VSEGNPRVLTAELAVAAQCELGEGPLWDPLTQRLLWLDIPGAQVHWLDPASGEHMQFSAGPEITSAGLTDGGGLIVTLTDGFATCHADGSGLHRLDGPAVGAGVRFNDGKPDPWGSYWAGTMATDEVTPAGSLYRLSPAGQVSELITGVALSNGLDWSDDRRLFYYIDSPTGGVDVFDSDPADGTLTGRRRHIDIDPAQGMPDGMTLDAEGCAWVAVWDGSQVRRYTPDGRLDTIVELPVQQVTSVAFGGPDLSVLFITTARQDFTAGQRQAQPHAGDLFCCEPGAAGRPAFRFSG